MLTKVFKLILAASFGHNAAKPVRAAGVRLAAAFGTSLAVGLLVAKTLKHLNLPQDLPAGLAAAFFTSCAFIITGLVVLTISSLWQSSESRLNRILGLLPLGKNALVLVQLLPPLLVWSVLFVFWLPLSAGLSQSMKLPFYSITASAIFGSLAAVGLVFWRRPSLVFFRPGLYLAATAASLFSLEQAIRSGRNWLAYLTFLLIGICWAGFIQLVANSALAQPSAKARNSLLKFTGVLLRQLWFAAKLVRNSRAVSSYLICLMVSMVTAVTIIKNRSSMGDNSYGWLIFSAVLAVANACDIRGLSRRYKAAEILNLSGATAFVRSQFKAAVLAGLSLGLPILLALLFSTRLNGPKLLSFAELQLLAVALGLAAGTFFVPRAGDIAGQFFAAVLALSCLFIILKFLRLLQYGQPFQLILVVLLTVLCVGSMIITEQRRNQIYGHA